MKIKIKKGKKGSGTKKKSKYDLLIRYFKRELDDHEVLQMEHMLHSGETFIEIANVIQNEWKKFIQNEHRTLKEKIAEYNRFVLKPKLLAKVDNMDVYNTLLSMKGKVESTQELTLLVLQQKKRVERLLAAENELYMTDGVVPTGAIATTTRKELKLMADILERLAKVQLETGILKRAPKFISGEFQRTDEKDPNKIQFQITENFFETLEAIDAEFQDVDLNEEKKKIESPPG